MAWSGRNERLAIHLWGIAERFDGRDTSPTPALAWRAIPENARKKWRMISRAAWRAADDHHANVPPPVEDVPGQRVLFDNGPASASSTSSPA